MDGIGHQVWVVVVHIHNLTVVEHLFVDDVVIGTISAQQHTLGLGTVGTVETDFHFDIVEYAQGVGGGIVAHRVDDQ